ncbi:hypothetical protein CesoFtcFv8_017107 [Champsocephalus esox]|uniref:Uncharacterized protein n=1 Tax=Champsocephalus esox TaxID=159716 RepID=A0AAN8GR80_9TELE|nr:hypothetical protein CesoFtcFv8_017107 [Champsocephalus esox]
MAVSRQRAHSVATLWGQAGGQGQPGGGWEGGPQRRRHREGWLWGGKGGLKLGRAPGTACLSTLMSRLCDNHSSVLV